MKRVRRILRTLLAAPLGVVPLLVLGDSRNMAANGDSSRAAPEPVYLRKARRPRLTGTSAAATERVRVRAPRVRGEPGVLARLGLGAPAGRPMRPKRRRTCCRESAAHSRERRGRRTRPCASRTTRSSITRSSTRWKWAAGSCRDEEVERPARIPRPRRLPHGRRFPRLGRMGRLHGLDAAGVPRPPRRGALPIPMKCSTYSTISSSGPRSRASTAP